MDAGNVSTLPGTGDTNETEAEDGVFQNTKEKRTRIAEVYAERTRIDGEIAELNEQRKGLMQSMKADTGVSIGAFNAAYKKAKMEQDKRAEFVAQVECAEAAMGVATQSEMFH